VGAVVVVVVVVVVGMHWRESAILGTSFPLTTSLTLSPGTGPLT
jgi:hypothetical protein